MRMLQRWSKTVTYLTSYVHQCSKKGVSLQDPGVHFTPWPRLTHILGEGGGGQAQGPPEDPAEGQPSPAQGPSPVWPRPNFANLGTWKSRNLGSKKSKTYKFSKFKSVLPKMSARSGLVGKNPPVPILSHLRPFCPWTGKMKTILFFLLFSLGGPLLLSTRGGGIG